MSCTIIVGGFFGDEGKGKIVAHVAHKDKPSIISRGGVGPNAGHTVKVGDVEYGVRMIPSGFVFPDAKLFIGSGVLVDPNVLKAEIEKVKPAKARPVLPALPDFKKWGPVERVPVRSIRRATAKQMALAWSQIPHVNSQDMVDITTIEAFRQKHKAEIEALGGKLTLTVFALKAVATALKTYPNFNASLDIEAGEIIVKHYYNIGIAIDTDEGLIVPVIRDVDRKSIRELSIELTDLVQRTRARKAALEEMQGDTFTITNVGHRGGGHFSPLINYPEVAILGMGAARLQPVVKEKQENGDKIQHKHLNF